MRMIFLTAAAALAVAGPAVAQNTTADTNASVPVADNATVDPANGIVATDNAMADVNMPADVPVTEDVTTTPVPREEKEFPWGVLGLIGLVGLLGRKRG